MLTPTETPQPVAALIDTHCHLDAPEFAADVAEVRARARARGVRHCVIPAVCAENFDSVRTLAQAGGDSYALGIHPLFVESSTDADLALLDAQLSLHAGDPRLVAVGEIGLDFFVPHLSRGVPYERQLAYYRRQLALARRHASPVILHVRRSADLLLRGLREVGGRGAGAWRWTGIAHAFNGSEQQAMAFVEMGFKLGFGGALTFERALQLRRLATILPLEAIVLETDAPDIAPHWLYTTAQARAAGVAQGRNEPGELPRIAQLLADLRQLPVNDLIAATTANAMQALPKLRALLG